MVGAVWKQDRNGKGIYVDHETTEEDATGSSQMGEDDPDWASLPDLILEKIYSYLSFERRYYCSLVCRRWYQAFHLPSAWSTFVLADRVLSRRRFNYHLGWQYTLDHYRAQIYLYRKGRHIRHLIFAPMLNFYNLGEVLTMLCHFAERYPAALDMVHTLKFTFNCDMAYRRENAIYGTGGQILKALKTLMSFMPGIVNLELTNLLLEGSEALHLLDEVCYKSCLTIQTLTLVNCTKMPCQLLYPGAFLNLHTLRISPQNIGSELLWLISCTKLKHLHIVTNAYTESYSCVNPKAWSELTRTNPALRVHFKSTGKTKRDILWQEKAPITSILYDSPYSRVTMPSILNIVDFYWQRLCIYGHLSLPRFHASNSFTDRIDSSLITLVRECSHLHTLVIRERISTATLILLATAANGHRERRLKRLYVRRNALLLRADWPRNHEWTDDYFTWLKTTSRNYESTQLEVSRLLDLPQWCALSDQQFKELKINVEVEP